MKKQINCERRSFKERTLICKEGDDVLQLMRTPSPAVYICSTQIKQSIDDLEIAKRHDNVIIAKIKAFIEAIKCERKRVSNDPTICDTKRRELFDILDKDREIYKSKLKKMLKTAIERIESLKVLMECHRDAVKRGL